MRYLATILLLFTLFACKKAEDRACFKFVGGTTTKEVEVGSFDKLHMGPLLKYVLVQDTVERVLLHGGKNLLNFIETNIDDEGRLKIFNKNKCNFLRDYDKMVTVEIHVKKIINILFEGSDEVRCENQINSDYLTLTLMDGAGQFNLDVNSLGLNTVITHGWGSFNLTGNVGYLKMDIGGNGWGNTYNLNVQDSLHIVSNSTEVTKVNANNCELKAETNNTGSIWYIGTPNSIEFNKYGDGVLVDKN